MTELARNRGLQLATSEDELPDEVDVLYAQESITAYRLAARYPKAPLAYGFHAVDYDLSVPPQLPELVSAVVTAHDRISRRAQALARPCETIMSSSRHRAESLATHFQVTTRYFETRGGLAGAPTAGTGSGEAGLADRPMGTCRW